MTPEERADLILTLVDVDKKFLKTGVFEVVVMEIREAVEEAVRDKVIEMNIQRNFVGPWEFRRLIETIHIQRQVLRTLFSCFQEEPLKIVTAPHTIRVATLNELKRLVSMEIREALEEAAQFRALKSKPY